MRRLAPLFLIVLLLPSCDTLRHLLDTPTKRLVTAESVFTGAVNAINAELDRQLALPEGEETITLAEVERLETLVTQARQALDTAWAFEDSPNAEPTLVALYIALNALTRELEKRSIAWTPSNSP